MRKKLTAIDLDELVTNMPELADAIRQSIPVGFRDQVDSASLSARELARFLTDAREERELAAYKVADWIRLGALDTLVGWVGGTSRTCICDPDPRHPQPIFATAWKPGLIVCARCVHLLKATRSSDPMCDGCGRDTTGDGITTNAMVLTCLTYQAGCCDDCLADIMGQAA